MGEAIRFEDFELNTAGFQLNIFISSFFFFSPAGQFADKTVYLEVKFVV